MLGIVTAESPGGDAPAGHAPGWQIGRLLSVAGDSLAAREHRMSANFKSHHPRWQRHARSEIRYIKSGAQLTKFAIAINRRTRGGEEVTNVDCKIV